MAGLTFLLEKSEVFRKFHKTFQLSKSVMGERFVKNTAVMNYS